MCSNLDIFRQIWRERTLMSLSWYTYHNEKGNAWAQDSCFLRKRRNKRFKRSSKALLEEPSFTCLINPWTVVTDPRKTTDSASKIKRVARRASQTFLMSVPSAEFSTYGCFWFGHGSLNKTCSTRAANVISNSWFRARSRRRSVPFSMYLPQSFMSGIHPDIDS